MHIYVCFEDPTVTHTTLTLYLDKRRQIQVTVCTPFEDAQLHPLIYPISSFLLVFSSMGKLWKDAQRLAVGETNVVWTDYGALLSMDGSHIIFGVVGQR